MLYNPGINRLYQIIVPTKCTKVYLNQLYTTFYIYHVYITSCNIGLLVCIVLLLLSCMRPKFACSQM